MRYSLLTTVATGCVAIALLVGGPAFAQDANPVVAKVNGAEIRLSDVTLAEAELGPSLQQMDPATRRENVIAFLIDMKIVSKAAEDKKIGDKPEFVAPGKPKATIIATDKELAAKTPAELRAGNPPVRVIDEPPM